MVQQKVRLQQFTSHWFFHTIMSTTFHFVFLLNDVFQDPALEKRGEKLS
jgi:hypothetical protein